MMIGEYAPNGFVIFDGFDWFHGFDVRFCINKPTIKKGEKRRRSSSSITITYYKTLCNGIDCDAKIIDTKSEKSQKYNELREREYWYLFRRKICLCVCVSTLSLLLILFHDEKVEK